jgi:hypothetical protein
VGDNGLDQVGRYFVHALAAAGRTESSFFATKRDKPLGFTLLASEPREPVGEYPAAKKGVNLLMHMPREGFFLALAATQLQEGFKILLNRAVKNRLLWLMPEIGCRGWK